MRLSLEAWTLLGEPRPRPDSRVLTDFLVVLGSVSTRQRIVKAWWQQESAGGGAYAVLLNPLPGIDNA